MAHYVPSKRLKHTHIDTTYDRLHFWSIFYWFGSHLSQKEELCPPDMPPAGIIIQ